jgi:hypothetical protein
MIKGRRMMMTVMIFIVIILIVTSLPYYINFKNSSLSSDPSEWGVFGDYFGGILNPALTIINIFVLLYLTVRLADIEDQRSKSDLALQKKNALFALQHDALKEINKVLEKVQPILIEREDDEAALKLILIRNELNAMITVYGYLFPSLDEAKIQLVTDCMMELSELCIEYRNLLEHKDTFTDEKIIPMLSEFNEYKVDFISAIQKDITS